MQTSLQHSNSNGTPKKKKKRNLEPNSLTTHIWCSGKQMHSPQTGTLCTKQYNLVAWNIQKINKKQINHSSTEQNFTIHQAMIKAKTEQDCIEFLRFCFSIVLTRRSNWSINSTNKNKSHDLNHPSCHSIENSKIKITPRWWTRQLNQI